MTKQKKIQPIFEENQDTALPKLWLVFKDGIHELVAYGRLAKADYEARNNARHVRRLTVTMEEETREDYFVFDISESSFSLEMDPKYMSSLELNC